MPIVPQICDLYHGNSLNLSDLVRGGMWAIIHKAKQGPGSSDPAYKTRMENAVKAGILWGAYDFSTHDNVAENVKSFLAIASDNTTNLFLDYEDNTRSEMTADQAYEFLDRIHQAGRRCDIYGGNRIREQIDHQSAKWIDMARVARLWQCRYIAKQPSDNQGLFAAISPIPPWTENFIIQYTGDGAGPRPHIFAGLENGADLNCVQFATKNALSTVWGGSIGSARD